MQLERLTEVDNVGLGVHEDKMEGARPRGKCKLLS